MTVRFGDCEVSLERIELRRVNKIVGMEPQVFDVLAYLLRHRVRRALPLARWSPLARHLLQRIYGTLIAAAPDADAALAVVDEAVERLDEPFACKFCEVMIAVPASIACVEGRRLDQARSWLARATRSAANWQGTAW